MKVRLLFKPCDCWIGVFWRKTVCKPWEVKAIEPDGIRYHVLFEVWICLLPMLPIYLSWKKVRERFL
jgi:hypothetical protein